MCITSSSPCFNALLCEAAILLGHHQSTPKAINKRTSPFALLRHSVLVVSHRHLSTQAACRATMQPGWEDHSACWVPGGCWEHDAASVCSCYGGEVVPRVASRNEVGQTGDALHNSWFSMNVCCALIKLTRDSVCWSSGTLYFVTCRKTGIQDDRVPVQFSFGKQEDLGCGAVVLPNDFLIRKMPLWLSHSLVFMSGLFFSTYSFPLNAFNGL